MTPERWNQVKQLFQEALAQDASARAVWLTKACAGDEELRRQIEELLAADEAEGEFLDRPVYSAAPELLSLSDNFSTHLTRLLSESLAGQRIGVYQLVREVGRGGMGEVYLAYDTRLGRNVALKVLPERFTRDEERVRRFRREARAASALNHPNILTIFDIGQEEGRHYIATEFVEGKTLRALVGSGEMTLGKAIDVAMQIASALAAAHKAGIIHRDIKPENVMVRPDNYVKVLDFGLAKLIEQDSSPRKGETEATKSSMFETQAGAILGTVAYMSPEQARGQKLDERSDLFSLGVVLYELVTSGKPFRGETRNHVIVAILDQEPPLLAEHAPRGLQQIVNRVLAKERDERYQTANDLLADLNAVKEALISEAHSQHVRTSGAQPVTTNTDAAAHTVSSTEYLVSELKRRKRATLAVLLVMLSAVAGLVYYWSTRPSSAVIDSLAVLPFVNQSRAPETDDLADGLTENIINNLAQLSELNVIARSSVFHFKGKTEDPLSAARQLGVRAVVVGRVLQQGDNLTIRVELVDVARNKQLWGQQYPGRLADLFAIQEEIAREISTKLRLKLTDTERQQLAKRHTANIKAFQYYTQGRRAIQLRTRENTELAIGYYEKALDEDPNYALAYAGLADAYTILGARAYIAPSAARRKIQEMARKALTLDENLAEAHTALGETWWYAPYNFALSDRAFRRALELNPNHANTYGYLCYSLANQGRFEESIQAIAKARELDPLSSAIARTEALPYLLKGDYARALELLRQATELGPPFTQTWEIGAYLPTKRFDQALVELEQAKRSRPNDALLIGSTGIVYAAQGRRVEALQIIKQLEGMAGANLSAANWVTKIYAALNEKEQALSLLERSLAADEIGVFYKNEPIWDPIRNTPRFAELMRQMGIPQ